MPRRILTILFILLSVGLFAQKKVEILRANSLEYSKKSGIPAKRLIGNVVFRHDELYMFCDSALFYEASNSVEAYHNVRFKQGDTILLIGEFAEYDGDSRIAKMRDSVILQHHSSYLFTDSLDYDRNKSTAYYSNGGKIFDGDNRLTSKEGYYYTNTYDFYGIHDVKLKNPDYVISSDTMKYNTESKIADFYGPTTIVSDSNYIYCEHGRYNTVTDEANVMINAVLQSKSNFLRGDSLYYDRRIRFGEAFKNVTIIDTAENMTAYGKYGYFYEEPEKAFLTGHTLLTYLIDEDTLFIHSDTVFIITDTANNKLLRAFHHVQAYKSDMQARCDSLSFHALDSIAKLYYDPVLWSDSLQATADFISVKFVNKQPDSFCLKNNSFLIQFADEDQYNQLSCKNINGYLKNKKLEHADLFSDCQTIYYITDEETEDVIALNKLISSNMRVFFKNNRIDNMMFFEKPDGQAIPMSDVKKNMKYLKGFRWLEEYKPTSKDDIFEWKEIPPKPQE